MLKNLEFASREELEVLLSGTIARAFHMASLGNEKAAMKAANDAKEINNVITDLDEKDCLVLSVTTSIEGRSIASDKELSTVWGS